MARRVLVSLQAAPKAGPNPASIPRSNQVKEHNMNWDQIEGNWKQIRGKVRAKWGELTNDDLDKIAGEREVLIGKLQERYGVERAEAEREVRDWIDALTPPIHR
jgi:uncharacterized protein YjbJ (UPF0337 family)